MNKIKTLLAVLAIGVAAFSFTPGADAQAPLSGYVQRSDLSTSTNWAEVVFPGAPEYQVVLKSLEIQSDSATNETWIFSGTRPITIQYSLASTQLVVLSNSLVMTNMRAIIQHPGSNTAYVVNILFTNNYTNVYIGGPGPVLAELGSTLAGLTNANATLWLCTNYARIWPGVGRLNLQGEAVHAGQLRAPLGIRTGSITGPAGGVSNQVRSAIALYYKQE